MTLRPQDKMDPKAAAKAGLKAARTGKPRKGAADATPRLPIFRVLPMLVGVAALMLSVRVHDVLLGVSVEWPVLHLGSETEAQQPPAAAPMGSQTAAAPSPAATAENAQPASTPKETASTTGEATAPTAPMMSPAEIDVLQKLTERRKQLDAREKEIEHREDLMKAASEQIDRKVSELKTLQNTIQSLLQQYNDQEDSKIKSLVKIYENMKPKDAAKIFEQLDMQILLDVVERMKEQKVAPILAEMDPSKAKTVTAEMAQRRQMPLPKPASGG
jgi:flagellar motility protein MotE (MotC chaperone)